jgi:hypothetical protein
MGVTARPYVTRRRRAGGCESFFAGVTDPHDLRKGLLC